MRLTIFWISNYLADIVGAFLATGILKLRGVGGHHGWQYLFLLEGKTFVLHLCCMVLNCPQGIATFIAGIAAFFMMTPGPTQTKAPWRPKGWFTERYDSSLPCQGNIFIMSSSEEVIIVNRVLRDDPSKSDMHNRQGLSVRMIWESLKDWHLWPIYVLGLTHMSKFLLTFLSSQIVNLIPQQFPRILHTPT